MKIKFFDRVVTFMVCLIFLFSALTFAADKGVVKVQGRVGYLNLKNKVIYVHEKAFVWDSSTMFFNEKGAPTTADKLQDKPWVYIEGLWGDGNKFVTIKKIYLLPKYIGPEEKDRYPFIQ
jgi:hypothetical protein